MTTLNFCISIHFAATVIQAAPILSDLFCTRPPAWSLVLVRPEFKVFTRQENRSFVLSHEENAQKFIDELNDDGFFDKNRQVVFLVHGFLGSTRCSPWLDKMKEAILKEDDSTVFVVDWRYGACIPEYGTAASNTETTSSAMSTVVGAILNTSTFNGDPKMIYLYCIGHSLGAHTCGQAGRKSKSINGEPLFDRITGLDPAGPGFESCPANVSIDKNSAFCVDIIHTDGTLKGHLFSALHLGTLTPWGHMDFYPNAGENQPGCTPFGNDCCGCSHQRAPALFLETIGRPESCSAFGPCLDTQTIPDLCANNTQQFMGYYSSCHYKSARIIEGLFYANAKAENPFC